jgi:hypothetical protein
MTCAICTSAGDSPPPCPPPPLSLTHSYLRKLHISRRQALNHLLPEKKQIKRKINSFIYLKHAAHQQATGPQSLAARKKKQIKKNSIS